MKANTMTITWSCKERLWPM